MSTAVLFAVAALGAPARAAEVHLFDDSLLEPGSPPPAHRLPVLFVHGHNPVDNDPDLNYHKNWWDSLNDLPSMKQAIEANPSLDIEPYYIRFEDQDHSITEDAIDIAEAVGAILHRHDPSFDPADPTDTTPVQIAIVGYSKGTISARQYLKSLQIQVSGLPAPRPDFRPVSEFVAISPPNHGLDTILFATTTSLAVRQLYNGYRPQGVFFDCGDSFNTAEATDYIEILNGHPIEDTMTAPFGDFPSEAPGSRPDGAAPHTGVLYVTLYASSNGDMVGGDDPSGDCQGRRVAKNLAPDAINIEVPVTGVGEGDIHQNTVHTKAVLCLALYAVAHHRSPSGQSCGTGALPQVPVPARAAAMLTLDLSGSMLAPVCSGCGSRLDTLKESVELFVQLWSLLGGPEDRLGVTYFRTDVDQYSGGALPLLIGNETALIDDVAAQTTQPFNMTAMGGGLQTAIASLDSAAVEAERRHVVLFTDGMQNVNPMVRPAANSPSDLEIADEAGRPDSDVDPQVPPMRLDQLGGITVDTIGIGAGEAFVGLLEDIAAETGGVTKATVAPDDELRRFFVEELISALRGFSPQLVGYRKGALDADGEATESFAVNAGVPKLVLKLSWRRGQTLGMRVFKDGVDVTASGQMLSGDFYRLYSIALPAAGGGMTSGGQWRIAIEGKPRVAYEAAAIVDERRLLFELAFGRPPVRVGEPLELQVRLSAGETPFAGELAVEAVLQRPRVAVGSLLAAMKRPGEPPAGGELRQRAEEVAVLSLLADATNAKRLAPATERLKLVPAGPGVYAASFRPTVPGIYAATVTIRGHDPKLGDVERTATATAVVRFGKAVLAASELRLRDHPAKGGDRMLELVVRPRDRYGNLLGPGLASSLAAGLSSGRVVGAAEDLGGGHYLFLLRLPKQPGVRVTLSVNGTAFFEGTVEELRRAGG